MDWSGANKKKTLHFWPGSGQTIWLISRLETRPAGLGRARAKRFFHTDRFGQRTIFHFEVLATIIRQFLMENEQFWIEFLQSHIPRVLSVHGKHGKRTWEMRGMDMRQREWHSDCTTLNSTPKSCLSYASHERMANIVCGVSRERGKISIWDFDSY